MDTIIIILLIFNVITSMIVKPSRVLQIAGWCAALVYFLIGNGYIK